MVPRRRRSGYALAVVGPVLVSVACLPLRPSVVAGTLALVLVLPVVGAAALAGRGGGVVAALVATACFDVLLTRPYGSFSIDAGQDLVTTLVLLAVGLIVAALVAAKERSGRLAADRSREVRSLRRVAGVTAGRGDPGWLITAAGDELVELLDADLVEYVPGPAPPELPRLGHGKVVVAEGAGVRPPSARLALPVDAGGRSVAHFVIELAPPTTPFTVPASVRARAVAIADVLGGALGRTARPSRN